MVEVNSTGVLLGRIGEHAKGHLYEAKLAEGET